MKPVAAFIVRWSADFVAKLLPQGAWARRSRCARERRGLHGTAGAAVGGDVGGGTSNAARERQSAVDAEFGRIRRDFEEHARHGPLQTHALNLKLPHMW